MGWNQGGWIVACGSCEGLFGVYGIVKVLEGGWRRGARSAGEEAGRGGEEVGKRGN